MLLVTTQTESEPISTFAERSRATSDERCARFVPSPLLIILAVSLLVRMGLIWWLRDEPLYIWDERDYDALALNIVRHREFAFHAGDPSSLRPPLYPAFLAVVYWIAGEQNYAAVRFLQVSCGLVNSAATIL